MTKSQINSDLSNAEVYTADPPRRRAFNVLNELVTERTERSLQAVSATHISMANYATPQSSSYVIERHSALATRLDMGLGISQCFYSSRRRDWSARKRKTIP
jgi:hypothetical protein